MKQGFAFGLLLLLVACGADSANKDGGRKPAGTAGTAGSSDTSTAGVGFDSNGNTVDGNAGVGDGSSGSGSDNSCGGMSYKGEVKGKLDIFVVFDLSGSMFGAGAPGPGGPNAKTIFESVSPAIKAFVSDPKSANIGIALRSFNDSCDVDALSMPDVPMADLPGNATPISSWLDAQWSMYMPKGYGGTMNYMGTNTYPAMQGGIKFLEQWQVDHPASKVVILLVTDGEPNDDCGSDDIPGIAKEGLAKNIPTYVLGLGNIASLNSVAAAGGTGQAFVVNDPAAASTEVADKLNMIRGAAQPLPCEFLIPKGGEDKTDLINLDYIATGATKPMTLPQVKSKADCGTQVAWYYDNPSQPASLVACDATCTTFSGGGGEVKISVGCPTVVIE